MIKSYSEYYLPTALHFVKQFPDLEFAEFKKMLRKKAGKGLTCDFEKLYQEYLEHWNDIRQTIPVPKENS